MEVRVKCPDRKRPAGYRCALTATTLLVLATSSNLPALRAGEPPVSIERDNPSQADFLRLREQAMAEAQQLRRAGDYVDAAASAERVLAIERRLFGENDPVLGDTLLWLSDTWRAADRLENAQASAEAAVDVLGRCLGPDHWKTVDARIVLSEIRTLKSLPPERRDGVRLAARHEEDALSAASQGEPREAIGLLSKGLQLQVAAFGERSRASARILDRMAVLYESVYDYPAAERSWRQSAAIRKELLGEHHPQYLGSLNRLGEHYYHTGAYDRAAPVLVRAADLATEIFGPGDPEQLVTENNLAELYHAKGDYAKAEALLARLVATTASVFGEEHLEHATTLNNLAGLYQSMGDYTRAEPRLREALSIREKALGKEHPDYATSLNNLGGLYYQMGRYQAAKDCFAEALAIRRRVFMKDHPDVATSVNNLAAACEALGELDQAAALYGDAIEIREKLLGPDHPDTADAWNNLAALCRAQGNYDQAERLYLRALEARRRVLGDYHPECAAILNNTAVLYRARGQFGIAADYYRQALDIHRRVLDATLPVLSERQQLAMAVSLRRTLDGFLSVTAGPEADAQETYEYVLWWKGMVFVHQLRARLADAQADSGPLLQRLQDLSSRLAALYLSQPEPTQAEAWRRQVLSLSEQHEQVEAQLAGRSEEYRAGYRPATPQHLRAVLPKGAALVDFLEYDKSTVDDNDNSSNDDPRHRHITAFVLRGDRPVQRFDLTQVAELSSWIEDWRRTAGRPGRGANAGRELRRSVWQPLEESLAGAATVLVSPDGHLARFPLAALPGHEAGTYLLEERTLAVVPVPQLLVTMLSEPARQVESSGREDVSLLLVGDIDYGSEEETMGTSAADARRDRPQFTTLESSRGEILAVRDSFELAFPDRGTTLVLRRQTATEARFCLEAPRHRYLHVATHGFFQPPGEGILAEPAGKAALVDRSDAAEPGTMRLLAGLHPGLFSGLALSAANTPAGEDGRDGILTAAEVAALDLRHVDLAVLSACETGLGTSASAEGLLGLQRAFQVAGARTVVASLWKVSDDATRRLMEHFYENLWNAEHPMGKMEALRQAQLALLHEGDKRGMALVAGPASETAPRRLPPFYWAAFVLSGDWR